ncbi:MAG: hypothetical protein WDN69_13310 [Aliidongia sp.]
MAQHEIRRRTGQLDNPMGIRVIEIFKPQGHVSASLLLDLSPEALICIGPVIEKWTLVKRQNAGVISRLIADEEPGIEAKLQKSIKNCHRHTLGSAPFVCGVDDHNFTELSRHRFLKLL